MNENICNHFESYVDEKNKEHGQDVLSIDFKTVAGMDQRIARIWMTYTPKSIPGAILTDIVEECKAFQRPYSVENGHEWVYVEIM